MSDRVVIVVQARMSSTRLPGKVLMPLAERPALARLLERVSRATMAHEVVVATSEHFGDDAVAALCEGEQIRCVRGSLENVLARYHHAARLTDASVVVRVTGDCPLHDARVIDDCIRLFMAEREHIAYASNVDERTYPDGLDVEVFDFAALDEAQARATRRWDREHVTPYLRRNFRKRTLAQVVDLQDLRWTLDYAADHASIGEIFGALVGPDGRASFSSTEIYRLLLSRPELIRTAAQRPLDTLELTDICARIEEQVRVDEAQPR